MDYLLHLRENAGTRMRGVLRVRVEEATIGQGVATAGEGGRDGVGTMGNKGSSQSTCGREHAQWLREWGGRELPG